MELRHIRYFIRAAELLHFTRAAESLCVSQPTLSVHIQQLEEEVGSPLFNRTGRHVRHVCLTEAGQRLLVHARSALRELERGKEEIAELRGLLYGSFAIATTYVFISKLISTSLPAYTTAYPNVNVVVKMRNLDDIERSVLAGTVDFALAWLPPESDEIESEPLFSDEVILAVSAKHPLAGVKKIFFRELHGLPMVLPTSATNTRRLANLEFLKENIAPKVFLEIDDIPARLAFVETSTAATLASRKAVMERPQLWGIDFSDAHIVRTAGILKHRGARLSSAAEAFAQMVRTQFKK
jgi:LysR family cyn operon transcriptional activator